MNKTVLLSMTVLASALTTGAVIAQNETPIAARQELMKGNLRGATSVIPMVRGSAPFEATKVDAAFAQWAETAQKLPGLFPDNSKTGLKTRSSPKIWQAKADFDAKAADFGKAVADNREKARGSLDGLKVAVPAVSKTCDNCHEVYRLPKQD